MSTFTLQILTPEREFFSGEVDELILPGVDGLVGVLPGHEPLIAAMIEGEVSIKQAGSWRHAACSDGFATITESETLILLQTIEWPEEIDASRARRAAELAKEQLRQEASMREYYIARASLARQMARLRLTQQNVSD